jgi:hypothetical protein
MKPFSGQFFAKVVKRYVLLAISIIGQKFSSFFSVIGSSPRLSMSFVVVFVYTCITAPSASTLFIIFVI